MARKWQAVVDFKEDVKLAKFELVKNDGHMTVKVERVVLLLRVAFFLVSFFSQS